jgi:serine/threonine-protein kinase RsbW
VSEQRTEVRVVVPAAPPFVRLVRLAAADVGARAGFSLDDIDDLRVAVDELCFTLTGQHGVASGRLDVTFELGTDEVVVRGIGRFEQNNGQDRRVPPPEEISEQILRAVLDELELEREAPEPSFRAVKRRRHP